MAAIKTTCTDGTELTTYDDRFRAVLGAEAKDSGATGTPADPGYAASLAACQT